MIQHKFVATVYYMHVASMSAKAFAHFYYSFAASQKPARAFVAYRRHRRLAQALHEQLCAISEPQFTRLRHVWRALGRDGYSNKRGVDFLGLGCASESLVTRLMRSKEAILLETQTNMHHVHAELFELIRILARSHCAAFGLYLEYWLRGLMNLLPAI